jgi:hypothetical protein
MINSEHKRNLEADRKVIIRGDFASVGLSASLEYLDRAIAAEKKLAKRAEVPIKAVDSIDFIIYISGPMTGYEELNFPAFHEAADKLRKRGYRVISPAEIEQPIQTWESCMKEDIKHLMCADVIATLPGWEKSKGARIEVGLAEQLGMKVLEAIDLIEITAEQSA